MQVVSRTIPFIGDPTINIYALGDAHIGSVHFAKTRFLEDVQTIADDPHGYWIGMGDFLDCIVCSDAKRFRPDEIATEYLPYLSTVCVRQRDTILEYLRPIADKCLGLHQGNHEETAKKVHYLDLCLDLCRELKTTYLGSTALQRLTFSRQDDIGNQIRSTNLVIYSTHGHCAGNNSGTPLNRLERSAAHFQAGVYLAGHAHSLATSRIQKLSIPSKGKAKLCSETQIFAITGCYLTSYEDGVSGYSERAGYKQPEIGCVKLSVRPQTLDMKVSI